MGIGRVIPVVFLICGLAAAASAPDVARFNPNWGAVLVGAKARALAFQCSRPSPGPIASTWIPTKLQIATMEPPLAALLVKQLQSQLSSRKYPKQAVSLFRVENYYRQYAGFVIGKREVIYTQGVIRSEVEFQDRYGAKSSWKTDDIMICDGGLNTFGVEYDVESSSFSNFSFNGVG